MGTDIVSFPSEKSTDRYLSAFMIVHAFSLAAIVFAGLVGAELAMSKAIAALISICAAVLFVGTYEVLKKLRAPHLKTTDALRLSPEGLSGRPFHTMGIALVPWTHLESVELDGDVVTISFAPINPASGKPADRITKMRIPPGATATGRQLKQAIDAYPLA